MVEKDLEELKKEYEKCSKKYDLPSFSKLNEEFEIEKLQEKETDFLLREIRRVMSEKIGAFLRFYELFINPSAAPFFVLSALKNLRLKERDSIEKVYSQLVTLELTSIALDISYDEKKEVSFIKDCMKKWQEVKGDMHLVNAAISKTQERQDSKGKSYFG